MNENEILLQLGALQRDRDAEQSDWESLVRGDVSASTLVELRLAVGADPDQVEQLASVLGSAVDLQGWIDLGLAATETRAPTRELLRAPRSRRSTTTWWVAGVAVLAAALALLWVLPAKDTASVELPTYALLVRNESVQEKRGSAPTVASYRPKSDVLWVIQPAHGTNLAHEIALLVNRDGGSARLLTPPPDTTLISEDGVVQLQGRFGAIFPLQPGRWEIRVLVGHRRPADLSDFEHGGPWQVTPPTVVDVLP